MIAAANTRKTIRICAVTLASLLVAPTSWVSASLTEVEARTDTEIEQQFLEAAKLGFPHVIESLLETDVDLKAANANGITALMLATHNFHPDIVKLLLDAGAAGSSPRGRGTPCASSRACTKCRFIPARAGNSASVSASASSTSVHPRAGGELQLRAGIDDPPRGSSPRGRGTPGCGRRTAACPRFIPARAGNSPIIQSAAPLPSVHPRAGGELPFWNLLIQKEIFLVKELTRFKPTGFGICPKFMFSLIT